MNSTLTAPLTDARKKEPYGYILKIAVVAMLLGRAWQHFFWQTPYGVLFEQNSSDTQQSISALFALIFLGASSIILVHGLSKDTWGKSAYRSLFSFSAVATVILALMFGLSWAAKNFEILQLLEHTLQLFSPLLLVALLYQKRSEKTILWTKIAIAITFTCHGLYAIGVPYGQPGHFLSMTRSILGVGEETASSFLILVGALDLVVSVGIFFKKTQRTALMYAVGWGFLTALARIVAHFDAEESWLSLHQWGFQFLVRLPHALFPLFLFLQSPQQDKVKTEALN